MHIGYDNHVPHWKVAAIMTPGGNAGKRLRGKAETDGRLMDATGGRKTRSMVVTDTNQVILSAVNPETLRERLQKRRQADRWTAGGDARPTGDAVVKASFITRADLEG